MIDYSIEVSFKFKDTNSIGKESQMVREELEKLSNEHGGDMRAFDYDNSFDSKTGDIKVVCLNYNYRFVSFENANNFILNLPTHYEILWILKNKSDYIIYSTRNKPDSKKFNSDDKNLYKTVLERIKNNNN